MQINGSAGRHVTASLTADEIEHALAEAIKRKVEGGKDAFKMQFNWPQNKRPTSLAVELYILEKKLPANTLGVQDAPPSPQTHTGA